MTLFDTTEVTQSLVPSIPQRRQAGLFGSLIGAVLTLGPRSRGSPDLSQHLRRDIGLPPVHEPKKYWDFL